MIKKNFIFLAVFGIAMGFLEAVVVVYLRVLYYPNGFTFPLILMEPRIISVELIREISTMIMLFSVAVIAGRNNLQRFSFFIYTFGIWDIFYYIGLKMMLNWPSSFLTWDILFLIPTVWLGPVLAPVICSLTMIILAGCTVFLQERERIHGINLLEWSLIISGAFIIFCTFIWDYSRIIISGGFLSDMLTLATNEYFQGIISQYVPTHFNWAIFALGEILILFAIALIAKRAR